MSTDVYKFYINYVTNKNNKLSVIHLDSLSTHNNDEMKEKLQNHNVHLRFLITNSVWSEMFMRLEIFILGGIGGTYFGILIFTFTVSVQSF